MFMFIIIEYDWLQHQTNSNIRSAFQCSSEGGMIRLKILIELKFLISSCSGWSPIELRPRAPRREIRADRISVNSTLPPLRRLLLLLLLLLWLLVVLFLLLLVILLRITSVSTTNTQDNFLFPILEEADCEHAANALEVFESKHIKQQPENNKQ